MVTVLLAVYNGEKYLREQIDSILNQTLKNIKIIIRDDGSVDNSPQIIKEYCNRYSQQIVSIEGTSTGSAARNFAELLDICHDDYIMFCDQDDVWLPQKAEKTLAILKSKEDGGKTPVLVHSDLSVVDQDLNMISPSFFEYQKLNQKNLTLQRLLVQNYVTGCTVMINRALKQKCGRISNRCVMHDWWLALVALLFGKLVCLDESTMLYRQHSYNQVGAKAAYGIELIKRKLSTLDTVRKNYDATYIQAQALLDRYGNEIDASQCELLRTYCKIQSMNKIQKIRTVQKYGFKKGTRLRVIGQYVLM